MLEPTRRRKSKIETKVTIQDESLWSCADLRKHFKFDILSDSMVKAPLVEAMLRIHQMVVEVLWEA